MRARTVLGFAVGPIVTSLVGLVSIPAIAWVFSTEDVGRLNVLQVTMTVAVIVLGIGLDQAYVREFHESHDRESLFRTTAAPGFALLAVAALVGGLRPATVSGWLYGVHDARWYWLTVACVLLAYLLRFVSLIHRMHERALAFSMGQAVPKVVLVVLVGVVAAFGTRRDFTDLAWITLVSTFAAVLVLAWLARASLRRSLRAATDRAGLRRWLRYSLPLMLAAVSYAGLTAISSVTVRLLSSFSELGVYSIASSVASAAGIVQLIFSTVWAPIVYRWVAIGADMTRLDDIGRQALAVVSAVLVLVGSFSWVIGFVLPSSYDQVQYLAVGTVALPLFYMLSEVTGIGVSITRRTTWLLVATVVALVLNVAISLVLVPHHGASGAVVANVVSYTALFIARTEASARVWRRFPRRATYVVVACAAALAITHVAVGPHLGAGFSLVWLALVPVVGWYFRDVWRAVLDAVVGTVQRRRAAA